MANQNNEQRQSQPQPQNIQVVDASAILELARAIVEGQKAQTEALIKAQPPRYLTVDEIDVKTPFNPTGIRERKLPSNVNEVYQNGGPLSNLIAVLHDEELRLIGRLVKGDYINGTVTVTERNHDGKRDLYINYKNATVGDRMAHKNNWKNLTDLLQQCVNEGEAKAALNDVR